MPNLYEFLVRFDGAGKFQGAHAQYTEGQTPLPAVPLSKVASADRATIKAVVGEAMLACLEAKEGAEAAALAAEERATVAEAKEAEAVAKVESVAHLIAIKEQLDAKDATAQALLAKVADLEAALAAKA